MGNKQTLIIQYLATVESATKKEIFDKVAKHWYYYNGGKHLGETLSRMVKAKKIKRLSKGVYALRAKSLTQPSTQQNNLFQ